MWLLLEATNRANSVDPPPLGGFFVFSLSHSSGFDPSLLGDELSRSFGKAIRTSNWGVERGDQLIASNQEGEIQLFHYFM
jgi:hypothetical protein